MAAKPLAQGALSEISREDLASIQGLVYEFSGISLDNNQWQLINNRLLGHKEQLGYKSWGEYVNYLRGNRQLVEQEIINRITTNKTEFFREKIHFEVLEDIIKREKREHLLFWSAACSRGHEVYSLDMTLDKMSTSKSLSTWKILGTDINTNVLTFAENAIYTNQEIEALDEKVTGKYFEKGSGNHEGFSRYRVQDRERIKFRYHHLLLGNQVDLAFDFIFLRNVLIYFNERDRFCIVKNLLRSLKEGGYLFLGLSETIDLKDDLEYLGNSVFRKKTPKDQRLLAKKKKILIVDDSLIIPKIVQTVLKDEENYEIVGHAVNTTEARSLIKQLQPDLITLDIQMPGEHGDVFYNQYLKYKNIPTIVVSSLRKDESDIVLKMMESGVSDYLQKPDAQNLDAFKTELLVKIETALLSKKQRITIPKREHNLVGEEVLKNSLIAIGASTGGTVALAQLLPAFPEKFPPTVIVQHIPKDFSLAFAKRLDSLCPFKVKEAEDGDILEASTVYIAPGNKQLKVLERERKFIIQINDDPPVNRHSPSVDYFFGSLRNLSPRKMIAVILTGMGRDGAQEMLELKKLGHKTIGQEEESCAVYGMPKAAKELGAIDIEVSLSQIVNEIFKGLK